MTGFPDTPITEKDIKAAFRAERRLNGCENCDSTGKVKCWCIFATEPSWPFLDDLEDECPDCADSGWVPCSECQEPA